VIRLFTAIELPIAARERLAALAGGVPGARWASVENMHLTLRFIGDVDEVTAADAAEALDAVRAPAVDIVIEGVGAFSRGKHPALLWAGVARVPALMHLQERIESALVRAGLEPEGRKFAPHVTLARLKGSPHGRVEDFIAAHALLRLPSFRATRFTLFSSFRAHDAPIYRAEADYPFAEG
jgi:2'-5' RNA ligase